MKWTNVLLFLIVASALFLGACKKQQTINIKGRYLSDCSYAPIANHKLRVSFLRHYSWFSSYQSVPTAGEGSTDNNGYFSFNFEKEYNGGEWSIVDAENGISYSFDYNKRNNKTIEVAEIFKDSLNYRGTLKINFKNRIDPTDTLFYKLSTSDSIITIYPISLANYYIELVYKTDKITASPYGVLVPHEAYSINFQWGIGFADFKKKDKEHLVSFLANPCNLPIAENTITLFK